MGIDPGDGTFSETRAAWRRMCRAFRWLLIECHLNMVVRLIRPEDPDALPLLDALSKHFDRWNAKS